MNIREVAIVFIENSQWKLLMQNRKSMSKTWEEWGFFGWGIENIESPKMALIREIKEELDLNLESKDLEFLWNTHWYNIKLLSWNIARRRVYVFKIRLDLDVKSLKVLEWDSAQFFTLEELKKLKLVWNMDLEAIMFYEKSLEEVLN